jgi:hypothetical protein
VSSDFSSPATDVFRLRRLLIDKDFCENERRSDPLISRARRLLETGAVAYGLGLVVLHNNQHGDDPPTVSRNVLYTILGVQGALILGAGANTGLFGSRPYLKTIETVQAAVRTDAGSYFWVFGFPVLGRVPGIDGQLTMRIESRWPFFLKRQVEKPGGVEPKFLGSNLMYTPSVSRMVDWYTSLGADNYVREDKDNRVNTTFAIEGGIRLRFPLPQVSWLPPLPPFMGFRLGVRTSSVKTIEDVRPIVEVGTGAY